MSVRDLPEQLDQLAYDVLIALHDLSRGWGFRDEDNHPFAVQFVMHGILYAVLRTSTIPQLFDSQLYGATRDLESLRLIASRAAPFGRPPTIFDVEFICPDQSRLKSELDFENSQHVVWIGEEIVYTYPDYELICRVYESTAYKLTQRGIRLAGQIRDGGQAVSVAMRNPLTDGQKRVWDALDGRILSGRDLAQSLHERGHITSPESIRQLISELRKKGRKIQTVRGRGYMRPDAPPPSE